MTEEQKYTVERKFPKFEVRRYQACVFADVTVTASFENAGSLGFRPLIGYISGNNEPNKKIAMTSPVIQESKSENSTIKIAMTPPVIQESSNDLQVVSFVMPAGMTLDDLPLPTNSKVTLRQMPEQLVAASRFTGRWTESAYERQLAQFRQQLDQNGMTEISPPRYARFDPPWTPSFLRRNEIQIPIATPTQ
jgi:hypothetical protein